MERYKIFISGPVSLPAKEKGYDTVKRMFQNTAEQCMRQFPDALIWNPMENCKPSWSWIRCMLKCLNALRKCDAVCFMSGWISSPGSRIEHRVATLLRKQTLVHVGGYVHLVYDYCSKEA